MPGFDARYTRRHSTRHYMQTVRLSMRSVLYTVPRDGPVTRQLAHFGATEDKVLGLRVNSPLYVDVAELGHSLGFRFSSLSAGTI